MTVIDHSFELYEHKQGRTFSYCSAIELDDDDLENFAMGTDFTGWGGACHLVDEDDTLIAELEFTWLVADQGILKIEAVDGTDDWPIGRAKIDIVFTSPSGSEVATDTLMILITKGITKV